MGGLSKPLVPGDKVLRLNALAGAWSGGGGWFVLKTTVGVLSVGPVRGRTPAGSSDTGLAISMYVAVICIHNQHFLYICQNSDI